MVIVLKLATNKTWIEQGWPIPLSIDVLNSIPKIILI